MTISIKVSLGCIFIAAFLWACSKDAGDNRQNIKPQQQQVLDGAKQGMISPTTNAFKNQLITLQDRSNEFCSATTGSHVVSDLAVLQNSWKEAMNLWMKLQVIRIDALNQAGLKLSIQFWPDSSNKVGLSAEQIIASSVVIDEDLIRNSTVQSQGLPVLEYLLFSNTALVDFNGSEGARRCELVVAVANNVSRLSGELYQRWLASDGFSSEQAAIDELVNGMVELLEIIQLAKLGNPLGGTNPNPEAAESYRSQHSLSNIIQNLTGLRELYLGGQGYGFDDYLNNAVNHGTTAAEMDSLIQQSISAAETISLPLTDAVLNPDQKALVQALEQQVLTLLDYIKNDFASAMNSTLGFNANDGD